MVKNKKLRTLFVLFFMLITATTITAVAENPIGTSFDFSFETILENGAPIVTNLGSKDFGSTVTIDPGTGNPNEFATYVVNGKVEQNLPETHTFIVNDDLNVDAYYKTSGNVMAAFIDSNQDLIDMQFISSGTDATAPDVSGYTMPGHQLQDDPVNGPWSGSYTGLSVDTVLYVVYEVVATPDTYTLSVTGGTGSGTYNFNEVVTVTASGGSGNFQYWEMGGMKVSQNPTYSFTILQNTSVTAVYDTPTSPTPDGLFLSFIMYSNIIADYDTVVGQFTLPDGQDLVEYGVIASANFLDTITLDTPDIEIIQSNKYNSNTNEYVRHLDTTAYSGYSLRGYMITTDGVTETVTYSDFPTMDTSVASDLFISEYVEGSGTNKVIEIFNGTGSPVNLSEYSLQLYSNGSTTPSQTETLSGTLANNDVYVIYNSTDTTIVAAGDLENTTVINFNGDDAVTLSNSSGVIDSVGEYGISATAGPWSVDGVDTQDVTLIRNADVSSPTATWDPVEWTALANDTYTNLGSHTMDGTSAPTSVTISGVTTMDQASTTTLTSDISQVYWKSSDESMATVSQNGLVSAIGSGSVTIYAYSVLDSTVFDTHVINIAEVTTFTVTFDAQGGSNVDSQVVASGNTATEPTDPTKTDKVFGGWYTDNTTYSTAWNFADPVAGDMTLYAKWNDPVASGSDLFISEYIEGSSYNKAVEIYNPTGNTVDLSNYTLRLNSGGTPTTVSLTGTLASGEVYVLCHSSANAAIQAECDQISGGVINFNGNDTLQLINGVTVIDQFGVEANAGGSDFAKDVTLVRNSDVIDGNTTYTTSEWTSYSIDYTTDLGSHTYDGGVIGPDTTPPVITVTDSQRTFAVDAVVPLGCTALDNVDGVVPCTYTGSVDSSIEGDYDITYTATDAASNTATLVVTYTISSNADPLTWDLTTYYDSAEGLSGTALESALTTIVNTGFNGVDYDAARIHLAVTDADPNISGNLILVYLQISRDGTWSSGAIGTWNREHVWPQSLLGVSAGGSTVNSASDLHNLKPADPQENSSRGNRYYTYDSLGLTDTYEPPDEVKGDVARILFYMTVMYNGTYDLELVDGIPGVYEMGDLATLLEWHEMDPVDDFELNRNEVIFGIQDNRNPFIDYPHFVELIWGTHSYYGN